MKINKIKFEHLQNWMLSGKTQAEYCREHGVNHSTFRNWRREEKSASVDWQQIVIKEEEKHEEPNIFSFQIGSDWKFVIELRLKF
jgi:transposase-like protein